MDMNTDSSNSTSANNDKRIELSKKVASQSVSTPSHQQNQAQNQSSDLNQTRSANPNPYEAPQSDVGFYDDVADYCDPRIFSRYGRLGRMRYFVYNIVASLMMYGVILGITMMEPIFGSASGALGTIFIIIAIVVAIVGLALSLYLTRRRLNDFDASGWWMLLMFVPYLNFIFSLVVWFVPGSTGTNSYGLPAPPNTPNIKRIFFACIGLVVIALLSIPVMLSSLQ